MKIREIREAHLKAIIAQQKLHMKTLSTLNQIPEVIQAIDECAALRKSTELQLEELQSPLQNQAK